MIPLFLHTQPTKMFPKSCFFSLSAFYPFSPFSDEAAVGHLKEMGPSTIDTELRGLAPDMGGSVSVMQSFLRMISSMLRLKRDFDLAQAYLALFLKV